MSNPVKNCFLIETFLYENKILRTHNFFCRNCTFLKARELENSCLLHWTSNVQITGLLHVKLVNEVDWKSVVKTWKELLGQVYFISMSICCTSKNDLCNCCKSRRKKICLKIHDIIYTCSTYFLGLNIDGPETSTSGTHTGNGNNNKNGAAEELTRSVIHRNNVHHRPQKSSFAHR